MSKIKGGAVLVAPFFHHLRHRAITQKTLWHNAQHHQHGDDD